MMINPNRADNSMLARRTSEQIRAEIEDKFGFFPPFFGPAQQNPQVLENLWQQTISAYINNPLPPLFKEKLSAYLSRYCAVPYCMICHSCCLRSLGMKAQEVLELLESPTPIETDIDAHLRVLNLTPDILTVLPLNSALEESLLYCAIFISLEQDQANYCRNQLRQILGSVNYQHLITFIAYVKTCHVWMEAHPEVAYAADKRVQDNLDALMEDELGLADFFDNYWERVKHERQSRAEQLARSIERKQAEAAMQQQIERERLVVQIAQRIRQSLNLEEILSTTVSEVRQFLQVDRVFIYRFLADWSGIVVVESVGSGWQPILGSRLKDPTFAEDYIQPYKQGRSQATADIYAGGLTQCYIDFLAQFQVRSGLVVPILQGEELWGLLVANHCLAPRQWQQLEIDLLKSLATQVAIAIQQSELYQRSQTELGDRQRAEQALSASLKDLADMKFALDQSSIVASTDERGIINYVNDKFCEISKYSREVLIGQNHRIINSGYHPQEFFREMWATITSGQVWKGEINNLAKDGEFFWVDITIVPFLTAEGQPYQYVAISRDITERKRAEEQIREQATLLDQSQDAILVLNMEGCILFWNKSANRLFGWTAFEALGTKVEKLVFKQTPSQLKAAQKTVALKGEWQGELHQVTKSSQEIIVESRWTLVRDLEGKPKSILVVNTDITKKKQLEAQFLRTQRMESIGTLAGGIAHDLNNVLTPIIASAQLLLAAQPDVPPEAAPAARPCKPNVTPDAAPAARPCKLSDQKRQRLLMTVETSAKRGAALVKQVLSFSRGVEGKFTILQLRHLLLEIKQIAKETFPKAIEFSINIPPELWAVSGDATQLHQVFMNLCVNARDAMPNGGTLKLSAENLSIDQNYARMHLEAQVGPYIVITVADTGTGIPAEILDRIFEPFFTTKAQGVGTGLGLSTVVGIIKGHGGFVSVNSTVGVGTQFKVYLPAVQGTATPEPADLELPPGQGELILVVDDEAAIRETTKTSLEMYNYKVLTASDGIEAIALYAQHKNDISAVLMDMMMPHMDGPTTIRTLQKINPQVNLIAFSGLVSSDKVSASLGTGVKAFLSKPYTAQELLKAINEVVSSRW